MTILSQILIGILGITTIIYAIATVTVARNSVNIIIYLIAVFISAGSMLIFQGIGFLGLSYLVVYVGGVAVLFLFVVIIFNIRQNEYYYINNLSFYKAIPYSFIAGSVYLIIIFTVFSTDETPSLIQIDFYHLPSFIMENISNIPFTLDGIVTSGANQIKNVGHSLLIKNAILFFTVAIVLLLALLGPIVLCVRPRKLYNNNLILSNLILS